MSDDQFTLLQGQIAKLDKRMASLDKGLLKMFQYMNRRFDTIERELENKADKTTVNLMHNQLDSFLKRTDTDETERAALGHQVERHDGCIRQIAKTTGNKLTY